MELGSVGIWGGGPWRVDDRAAEAAEVAAELEELGFGALWVSGGQRPGLSPRFRRLLDGTARLPVASGILNVWLTDPAETARAVAELEAAHPGRFLLGVGVSHAPLVERTGQSYQRPWSRMVEWLDGLDRQEEGVPPDRRMLAALGPRMLALAAQRSAGAHPYFVPVEHTRSLGYSDSDLAGAGSDRLVDAVVAWGDEAAVARRVREHLDAGADHVCVQVLGAGEEAFPLEGYRRLAAALLG